MTNPPDRHRKHPLHPPRPLSHRPHWPQTPPPLRRRRHLHQPGHHRRGNRRVRCIPQRPPRGGLDRHRLCVHLRREFQLQLGAHRVGSAVGDLQYREQEQSHEFDDEQHMDVQFHHWAGDAGHARDDWLGDVYFFRGLCSHRVCVHVVPYSGDQGMCPAFPLCFGVGMGLERRRN
jgi:hypothetical protein